MFKEIRIKRVAIITLLGSVLLTALIGQSPPQDQHIRGGSEPEKVPAFLAWRAFLGAVHDAETRTDTDWILNQRVGLNKLYRAEEKELQDLIRQTIADHATLAVRGGEKANEKTKALNQRSADQGLSDQEYQDELTKITREQIRELKSRCARLQLDLMEIDPERAPLVWQKIRRYVREVVAGGVNLSGFDLTKALSLFAEFGEPQV